MSIIGPVISSEFSSRCRKAWEVGWGQEGPLVSGRT